MSRARLGRLSPETELATGSNRLTEAETENSNPALEEASRELQAAQHDAQVAFDCIALGDIDRAHTHALTAKIAADARRDRPAPRLGQPAAGPS
jgi:hypothetical protein